MNELRTLLAALAERYPVIAARLPLAIGVREELVLAGYDAELLRRSLYQHVHGIKYQRLLFLGGKRFHLDGIEAGEIDPEHVEFARQKIEEFDQQTAKKMLLKKELKAKLAASLAVKAIKPEPAPKPAAKALPAAPLAVTVVVKKKRIVQVPK